MRVTAATVLSVGRVLSHLRSGDGHAYMMNPISRQLYGTEAFQESGAANINYCPHCFQSRGPAAIRERGGDQDWPHFNGLRAENGNYIETDEVAKRHGVCGDPEQTAAEGSNKYGLENSNYPVMETYAEGGILEVKVVVSTYHWGHVEMFLCDANDLADGPDGVVTQACFNKYPLDRAEDDEFNGPIDPANRGRFILDPPCRASETDQEMVAGAFPGDVATARFQLPQGVTCDRCVVQMVYYTGNSCKHEGYAEFNPTSWPSTCAPSKADWINEAVGQCGDGPAYPEEFWNCADIEITSDGGPAPSPVPTTGTPETTAQPVDMPVAPPATDDDYSVPTYTPDEVVPPTPAPTIVEEDTQPLSPAPTTTVEEETQPPTPVPTTVEEETQPPTPAPTTVDEETQRPTPAPTTAEQEEDREEEEEEEREQVTPAPSGTTMEATFAPSVPPPVPTHEDCNDPVAGYNQCGGGDDYDGSTCCRSGYECLKMADCYSECRPKEDGCSEGWGQCGGIDWDGPTCCWPGALCLERNEWYSQCVPEQYIN